MIVAAINLNHIFLLSLCTQFENSVNFYSRLQTNRLKINGFFLMFYLIASALTTTILVILIFHGRKIQQFFSAAKCAHKVPGPPSKFWGNISPLIDTPENIFKVLRKWGSDYYPVYRNWVLYYMFAVNIVNPDDFETVMSNTKHNTKGYFYHMFHDWLGTGLLTSEGDKWQERRKVLTPSFHFNVLQEYIQVFNKETKNLVQLFKAKCHQPYIPITDYISDFTLNSIGETAMGTSFHEETVSGRDYKNAIYEIGKVYVYRLSRPWLLQRFLYYFVPMYYKEQKLIRTLHKFTNDVISKREKNFKPVNLYDSKMLSYSKRKRLVMLDLLLTTKKNEGTIDDKGIREEVNTFMFEGHDTTSVAICYALMLIACNRSVQDRIYEEIQEILPNSREPDYQTLQDFKYMDRCIKEVLRIYPSVPFIARVLGKRITTKNGYVLRAGTIAQLHIYDVHHNPNIYPDPEKFDPDRFLPENSQNRHNFAYVPFSAGSRNCIGQKFAMLEIKAVLSGILSEFILEPVDTPETIVLVVDLVLRTKESIKVKFVPRNKEKV